MLASSVLQHQLSDTPLFFDFPLFGRLVLHILPELNLMPLYDTAFVGAFVVLEALVKFVDGPPTARVHL